MIHPLNIKYMHMQEVMHLLRVIGRQDVRKAGLLEILGYQDEKPPPKRTTKAVLLRMVQELAMTRVRELQLLPLIDKHAPGWEMYLIPYVREHAKHLPFDEWNDFNVWRSALAYSSVAQAMGLKDEERLGTDGTDLLTLLRDPRERVKGQFDRAEYIEVLELQIQMELAHMEVDRLDNPIYFQRHATRVALDRHLNSSEYGTKEHREITEILKGIIKKWRELCKAAGKAEDRGQSPEYYKAHALWAEYKELCRPLWRRFNYWDKMCEDAPLVPPFNRSDEVMDVLKGQKESNKKLKAILEHQNKYLPKMIRTHCPSTLIKMREERVEKLKDAISREEKLLMEELDQWGHPVDMVRHDEQSRQFDDVMVRQKDSGTGEPEDDLHVMADTHVAEMRNGEDWESEDIHPREQDDVRCLSGPCVDVTRAYLERLERRRRRPGLRAGEIAALKLSRRPAELRMYHSVCGGPPPPSGARGTFPPVDTQCCASSTCQTREGTKKGGGSTYPRP